MRELLFRGKRTDNGEWVYGYYTELPVGSIGATIFSNDDEIVCEDTASYIIKVFEKQHSNYSNGNPLQVIECENYEVIPDTLGQYTGLKDKNGKRIFEGDILKNETGTIYSGSYNCEVVFRSGMWFAVGFVEISPNDFELCEVIGNIHDNLELLDVVK